MSQSRPIIVIKKKGGHGGGHNGGAWKVAYADFVTAMMSLFIVLWLLNSSKKIQEAVGGYFKDPSGFSKKLGSNMMGAGENFVLTKDNMPKLKDQLQQAMKQMADFEKLKRVESIPANDYVASSEALAPPPNGRRMRRTRSRLRSSVRLRARAWSRSSSETIPTILRSSLLSTTGNLV